jgi:hypothetical protein
MTMYVSLYQMLELANMTKYYAGKIRQGTVM